MKLFKKLIPSALAVPATFICLTAIQSMAAEKPIAYAKLQYVDENMVRVDVYVDNIESYNEFCFHLHLGDGLDVAHDPIFPELVYKETDCSYEKYYNTVVLDAVASNEVFAYMAIAKPIIHKYDIPITSFYAYKNSKSNDYTLTADVLFEFTQNTKDEIGYTKGKIYTKDEITQLKMSKSVEYVLGDTDGNGITDTSDAYVLKYALTTEPFRFGVSEFVNEEKDINDFFPGAKDPYALDVNCDGVITNSDAVAIYQYLYSGDNYTGNIGKHFYHSYY
ncbi:MAG: hypothetical protein K5979_01680 [Ruminococcus sp.]|nr:hypothetical protein [Ruminococcus sp.]